MGLFDNIVKIGDKVGSVNESLQLAANDPIVTGVKQAVNLLPEGGLKEWVSANPIQFWKKIIQLITGRKYTTGQYVLGERFIDQILPGANDAARRGDVPDDIVLKATDFFTIVFGVRITTQEDMDALDYGPDAYYKRPDKTDIPRAAVNRAVFLKQNYFPISSYNVRKWDTTMFEKYPLVAPIPGIKPGTLYSGELPGGAIAVNGVVPADYALQQVNNTDPDKIVTVEDLDTSSGMSMSWVWIAISAVVIIIIIYFAVRKK